MHIGSGCVCVSVCVFGMVMLMCILCRLVCVVRPAQSVCVCMSMCVCMYVYMRACVYVCVWFESIVCWLVSCHDIKHTSHVWSYIHHTARTGRRLKQLVLLASLFVDGVSLSSICPMSMCSCSTDLFIFNTLKRERERCALSLKACPLSFFQILSSSVCLVSLFLNWEIFGWDIGNKHFCFRNLHVT